MYAEEDHEAKVLYEAKMERYKTSLNIKRADDFPYMPNNSHIHELDHFCDLQAAKIRPLASHILKVLSKPGFGKSALLHYWVLQRQLSIKLAQGSGSFLFTHFVNSSQDEKLSDMLGSLEYELKTHFHLRDMTLRKTANQRRWDLPRFLDAANRKSRGVIIIVIDGLSKLKMENGQEADPMLWLPRDLPENVRVICSLTKFEMPHLEVSSQVLNNWVQKETSSYIELARRGCPKIELQEMPLKSRQSILGTYARYHVNTFHLTQDQIRTVMENKGSSHPLYLRILLNSMRTLAGLACIPDLVVSQLLENVKEVQSVDELLFIVLELCEKDVEMNLDGSDKGLLPRILSLLYVSHKGLSEEELFDCIMSIPGYNIGVEHKKAIHVILKDICMVVEVQNIIHMENETVRRVVWQQYICNDENRRENHHILSHFFKGKEVSIRRVEELPWHYERLEEYGHLRDVVTDIDMFNKWWSSVPHRPELLRTWGILTTPPSSMDVTFEYNAMFEKQTLSRGMDDITRFNLFMRLGDFFFSFSRDGYEDAADCPPLQHSDLSWDELKDVGVAVKDNKHDGDHIKLDDTKKMKKNKKKTIHVSGLDLHKDGHGSANPEDHDEDGDEHSHHPCYNYYRWLWIQFPWLRLGLYKEWKKRQQKRELSKNAALANMNNKNNNDLDSPNGNNSALYGRNLTQQEQEELQKQQHEQLLQQQLKQKSVRKDPIVLRLERITEERLHKQEELERRIEREVEEEENRVSIEAKSTLKQMNNEEQKRQNNKKNSSPYRVKMKNKLLKKKQQKKNATPTKTKKQNKWVIKFTPPGGKHISSNPGDNAADRLHFTQRAHVPHINGANILDLDKKEKFSKKISTMSGGTVAQRNELNKILLQRRAKQRELQTIENELQVLNGLQEGETLSVGKAYSTLDKINKVKEETVETSTQSKHYMAIIDMMERFPANNGDWLEQIDDIVEKMEKKEKNLEKNTRKANDEFRVLMQNLPEFQKEVEKEQKLQAAFIARLSTQQELEEKDREQKQYFAMRQKALIESDITRKRQTKEGNVKKKVIVKGTVTKIRKRRYQLKVKRWEARIQRLRDATGGMDIADILNMLADFSQDDVHSNLKGQVEMNQARIARLEDARDRLLVHLKLEMRNKKQTTASMALANKDEELTKINTRVDASIQQYLHFQHLLTEMRAGLDHISTTLRLKDCTVNDDPLVVLKKIENDLVEKMSLLEKIVPDLVHVVDLEETKNIRKLIMQKEHHMIGKELGEIQHALWESISSSIPKLKDQEWVSNKIHVDLKRMAATKAGRPYTPDVLADDERLPIASIPRRQFTMDQSKLEAYSGLVSGKDMEDVVDIVHGGGGGGSPRKFMPRDTVIDRKQFKLASKHAAEKYQAKTKAMMKKKEKEDLEKWFANTGGGGGQRNDHHDNPDHHRHRRHNRGNTTM